MTLDTYRRNITLPSLGSVSINFHCISRPVYELYNKCNEFDRQKNINHLGLVSHAIDGANHSRYEYVMLQCAISDILERLHKGIFTQGSLKIDGVTYEGNSILKAWFLLSNFGHAKNTFGDEKSLIQYALRRKGFRSALLKTIKSDFLKGWCEKIIDGFHYQKFHYVLTIYRIYKNQPNLIEKQNLMSKLLEVLLIDEKQIDYVSDLLKLKQLKKLFTSIRNLAILRLDGYYSHTPVSIDLMSYLVSFDEIEGGVFGKNKSSSIRLNRSLLHEELYLDSNVLALQRYYELNSLKLLFSNKRCQSYHQIIDEALNSGIIKDIKCNLTPFFKVAIPKKFQPDTSFYDELRRITLSIRKGCKNVESYLDLNPFTGYRYAEFFITENFEISQMPKFLFNISNLIRDQLNHVIENIGQSPLKTIEKAKEKLLANEINENLVNDSFKDIQKDVLEKIVQVSSKQLFPSFRDLLLSLIKYFFKDSFRLEIDQKSTEYENYAFALDIGGDGSLLNTLDTAILLEEQDNKDRAHEIKMLRHLAKRKYEGFKVAFFMRLKIFNLEEKPQKMLVTDIDSVFLKISANHFELSLLEAKNMKRKAETTAKKELKQQLVPVLNNKARYSISEVKNYGAKLSITFKK